MDFANFMLTLQNQQSTQLTGRLGWVMKFSTGSLSDTESSSNVELTSTIFEGKKLIRI